MQKLVFNSGLLSGGVRKAGIVRVHCVWQERCDSEEVRDERCVFTERPEVRRGGKCKCAVRTRPVDHQYTHRIHNNVETITLVCNTRKLLHLMGGQRSENEVLPTLSVEIDRCVHPPELHKETLQEHD